MINKLPVVGKRYEPKPEEVQEPCPIETAESIWNMSDEIVAKRHKVEEAKQALQLAINHPLKNDPNGLTSEDEITFKAQKLINVLNSEEESEVNETPLPIEKKEISEVERALEELKKTLFEVGANYLYSEQENKNFVLLGTKAQNLLTALEAEKAKTHQLNTPVSREYTPAPEPKIDMKEECVEPVNTTITVGFEPNGRVMTPYEQIEEILEQIQKDIEEVKQQIKKQND